VWPRWIAQSFVDCAEETTTVASRSGTAQLIP
jgi:hypothetical protein